MRLRNILFCALLLIADSMPALAQNPDPPVNSIVVPVPGGGRVIASVHRPQIELPDDHDFCPLLRRRLVMAAAAALGQEPGVARIGEYSGKIAALCLPSSAATDFDRGEKAVTLARSIAGSAHRAAVDEELRPVMINWAIRMAARVRTVADVTGLRDSVEELEGLDASETGLAFMLLKADVERLTAVICQAHAEKECRAQALAAASRGYADLSRLTDDAYFYSFTLATANDAQNAIAALDDADVRNDLTRTVSVALGYAGEAGRSRELVERALAMARDLEKSEAAKKGSKQERDYYLSVDLLATQAGRLSAFEKDPAPLLREAIAWGKQYLDYITRMQDDAWDTRTNIAVSQIELYALANELPLLSEAEKLVREARAELLSNRNENPDTNHDLQYVQMRLAQILSLRLRDDRSIAASVRTAMAKESRTLNDAAKKLFLSTKAQLYLDHVNDTAKRLDRLR